MRGKLTFDKLASNMSIFFKAIDIVAKKPGGLISRKEFVNIIAQFIDSQSTDGGKERTSYNKSNFPRYFGFLDLVSIDNDNYLKITKRGDAPSYVYI